MPVTRTPLREVMPPARRSTLLAYIRCMPAYICVTCGTQYPESASPPQDCPICNDERQYVGWKGQTWTTSDELRAGYRNRITPEGAGLTGIGTEPKFAIGQRALHLNARGTGVLWDCISLVDDASIGAVRSLGGAAAIAISHPHYYSSMVEWSRALGDVPIYLHAADSQWVVRHDRAIVFWDGETREIAPGVTLIRCGGHFPGATVLHWSDGADGQGALLSGDVIMVGQDRRTAGFMYSYPNYIPLAAQSVRGIGAAVEPFEFEQIFGAWFGQNILEGGKQAVRYSVRRYVLAISDRDRG
jgi:glyoxylase-like metal-dependent hydrolase (beta-lactamase superfamily II)